MATATMVVGGNRDSTNGASVWGMKSDGTVAWTYDTGNIVYRLMREPTTGYYYIVGVAADNGDGNGTRNLWILDNEGNYINGAYVGSKAIVFDIDIDSNYVYVSTYGAFRLNHDLTGVTTIISSGATFGSIKVDSSGNIYAGAGGIADSLIKWNSSLVYQWSKDTNDSVTSIDMIGDESAVIVGTSDGETRRYEADGSSVPWGAWAYVWGDDNEIKIDSSDNVYVAGTNSAGGILVLDINGNKQWEVATDMDLEHLFLDQNGVVYGAGEYGETFNIFKVDSSDQKVYGMMNTGFADTLNGIDADLDFAFSLELKDDIEGFWKMNDADASPNVDDASSNNRDGTATKDTSDMTTTGKVNEALRFKYTDSDGVGLGDLSVFDLTPIGNKTLSFWLKWSGDGGLLTTIFHKYEGGVVQTGWTVHINKSSNRIYFQVNGLPLPISTNVDLDNVGSVNDWHLVLLRIDRSGNCSLSLDNRSEVSATDMTPNEGEDGSNDQPFSFGGNAAVNGNYSSFDGELDVIGFWSRLLTEEEESQIWNGGSGTEDFGLIDPPVITDQTSSPQDANYGDDVVLSVTVTGTSPFTYQWYKDGSPIAGATSSSLTLSSVDKDDGADYTCTVTNPAGSDTSSAITVRIVPYITAQSSSTGIARGSEFSLSVTGEGSPSPTYQWYKNGNVISGETSSTLTKYWTDSDAGTYTCVLTNAAGSTTSSSIVVTIVGNPYAYNLFDLPFDISRETP